MKRNAHSRTTRLNLREHSWTLVKSRLALSPRECEILKEFFNDSSEIEIAHRLGISPHTVHSHCERLYRKLGASTRAAVLLRAFAVILESKPHCGLSSNQGCDKDLEIENTEQID